MWKQNISLFYGNQLKSRMKNKSHTQDGKPQKH